MGEYGEFQVPKTVSNELWKALKTIKLPAFCELLIYQFGEQQCTMCRD